MGESTSSAISIEVQHLACRRRRKCRAWGGACPVRAPRCSLRLPESVHIAVVMLIAAAAVFSMRPVSSIVSRRYRIGTPEAGTPAKVHLLVKAQ